MFTSNSENRKRCESTLCEEQSFSGKVRKKTKKFVDTLACSWFKGERRTSLFLSV